MRCPECGQPAPNTDALDWHIHVVHRAQSTGQAANDGPEDTREMGTSEVRCPECGMTFAARYALEIHRQSAHSAETTSPFAEPYRSSNRKIGCVLYSVMYVGGFILASSLHWDAGFMAVWAIGIPILYFITAAMDENTADWKEATREEFHRNYLAPPAYTQVPVTRVLDELTEEQRSKFPEYVLHWREVGLNTKAADRPTAERSIGDIYGTLGLGRPRIIWCSSPLASGLARALTQRLAGGTPATSQEELWMLAHERVSLTLGEDFWKSVRQSVQVGAGIWPGEIVVNRIRAQTVPAFEWNPWTRWEQGGTGYTGGINAVGGTFDVARHTLESSAGSDNWEIARESVELPVSESVDRVLGILSFIMWNGVLITKRENKKDEERAKDTDWAYTGEINVTDVSSPDHTSYQREKVKARVRNTLGERPGDSIGNSVRASIRNSCYGQHDAALLGLFAYFRHECGLVSQTDRLIGQFELAESAGWYLPHEKLCWVSERPSILHLSTANRLHSETGPALQYPDGWSIYALNGVLMKPDHVLTPAGLLDPAEILGQSNVDIRRELLRKVGVTRMISYGKEIDRQGDYRLIDMSPVFRSGIRYAPYLLMPSASVEGAQHLEGVSPECRTVEQAINWRASNVTFGEWTPDLLS